MADSFFGFNASLPSLGVRAQQDINFPDAEDLEEEEYNALNDETFGCDGSLLAGDWEPSEGLEDIFHGSDSHNGLSGDPLYAPELASAEEEDTVHQINASIKQLELDGDQDDPAIHNSSRSISSPINVMNHGLGSFGRSISPPGLITRDEIGSPQTHSIWAANARSSSSFEDRFSAPLPPGDQTGSAFKFSSPFTTGYPLLNDVDRASASSLQRSAPRTGNDFAMKNDWLWGKKMAQNGNKFSLLDSYGIHRNISSSHQLHSALGRVGRVSPGNPMSPSLQPSYYAGGRIEDSLNAVHPVNFFNFNRNLNNRQFLQKNYEYNNTNKSSYGYKDFKNGFKARNDATQRHWHEHRHPAYSRPHDEYAGLMTAKEKNWLIHIQLMQLHTDNPYIDDYYYTAYMLKKMAKQRREEGSGDQEPTLILPDSNRSEVKAYSPPQIENSLGRLQIVSVLAPRRIIDVTVVSADVPSPRDTVKPNTLLLDIELVYDILLKLQTLDKHLQALQDGPIKDNTLKEHSVHLNKLRKYMSVFERLQLLWMVRKGKTLLLRVEPYLEPSQWVTVIEALFSNLSRIIKRDQVDRLLPNFLVWCQEMIGKSPFAEVVKYGDQLLCSSPEVQIADHMTTILSDRLGFTVVMLLIQRGEELFPNCREQIVQDKWCKFVLSVVEVVISSKVKCVPMLPIKSILDRLSFLPIKGGQLKVFMEILTECEVSSGSGDS